MTTLSGYLRDHLRHRGYALQGLEFQPGEQQVAASSGAWVKRQLSRMRSVREESISSPAASTSRFRLQMPRLWRANPADIEMGEYTMSLHSDIKKKFGAVNPMRS